MAVFISIFAIFSQVYTQITITSPTSLAKSLGKINIFNANYGYAPNGHLSNVFLFVLDNFNNSGCTGCTPYEISFPNDHLNEESRSFTYGLLVDRGDCSFVNKTRNAQNLGIDILVIADDQTEIQNETIVLNDDGTGDDIIIPTVLISKVAGDALKAYLFERNNADIYFSVNFELAETKDIEIDIFGSSERKDIYDLLHELKLLFNEYSDEDHRVRLDVNYVSNTSNENRIGEIELKNCLGGGRYCIWTGLQLEGSSIQYDGREILNQNIIQKCMHNISFKALKKQRFLGQDYFNYMESFKNQCLNIISKDINSKFLNECSHQILFDLNIISEISKCVKSSFLSTDPKQINIVDNKILSQDNVKKVKYGIQQFPSVTINKRLIDSNNLQGYAVIQAICTTIVPMPKFCDDDATLLFQSNSTDLSALTITSIIFLVIILNVVIVYFCKRYIVRKMHEKIESTEMNGKINNVVSSYLALRG